MDHFDVVQSIGKAKSEANDKFDFSTMHRKPNAIELELMAEDELARLQRKYRDMDMATRKYQQLMSEGYRIHKKGLMRILLKERKNLQSSLQVAASPNNKRMDVLLMNELRSLLGKHAQFKDDIELRKIYVKEVEDQIKNNKSNIVKTNVQNKASEQRHQERVQVAQKNIYKLENRLEVQMNRFCCILTENVKLRNEIKHLMKERELFEKDWEKFFHILALCKKFMYDLMEQTMIVYNQREEYCQKIDVLLAKAKSDIRHQSENMQEMHRVKDDQNNLYNLLVVKSQKRIAMGAIKKALLRQQKNEIEIRRKRDQYTKILQDIHEYAESNNINEIQMQFILRQEYIFSTFAIINHMNEESEDIAAKIQYLRDRWAEEVRLVEMRTKNQAKTLDSLRMYLKMATDEVDVYREKITTQNKQLNSILEGISGIFATIKFDPQSTQHLLGQIPREKCETNVAVTADEDFCVKPIQSLVGKTALIMDIYNVDIFLADLEQRITEMMRSALVYQRNSSKQYLIICKRTLITLKIEEIKTPCPICLEDSQSVLCPTATTSVLTRPEIVERLAKHGSEFRLLESNMHSVSKCKMPQATVAMKNRYMNE